MTSAGWKWTEMLDAELADTLEHARLDRTPLSKRRENAKQIRAEGDNAYPIRGSNPAEPVSARRSESEAAA